MKKDGSIAINIKLKSRCIHLTSVSIHMQSKVLQLKKLQFSILAKSVKTDFL